MQSRDYLILVPTTKYVIIFPGFAPFYYAPPTKILATKLMDTIINTKKHHTSLIMPKYAQNKNLNMIKKIRANWFLPTFLAFLIETRLKDNYNLTAM